MEKENKKMKAPLYKKEKQRINKLVTRAKKYDPRILKFEKEEREAREARKKEIEARKKAEREKKEALIRQKEEERRKKKEEEQARLQAIEDEKRKKLEEKANRKTVIKNLVKEKVNLPQYSNQFIDIFLDKVKPDEYDQIKALLQRGDLDLKGMQTEFKNLLKKIKERQRGGIKKAKKNEGEQKSVTDMLKDWTQEEISLLTKAFSKFPSGFQRRWENIAEFIGGQKKVSDVIKMAKKLSIQNMKGGKGLDRKMAAVMKAKNKLDSKPQAKPAQKAKPKTDEVVWTQEEQSLLEKGLKSYPSSLPKKERWGKISELVKTKSPKQCFQRVKEIKAKLAAKKKASKKE